MFLHTFCENCFISGASFKEMGRDLDQCKVGRCVLSKKLVAPIFVCLTAGRVKKLDTLFFLNIWKNNYPSAPKPFVICHSDMEDGPSQSAIS